MANKFYIHPQNLCSLFFFFFWIARVFAGGCVSSQQMTYFLHTHHLTNTERPLYMHNVSVNTAKKILLYINSCYDKDVCGCGKCLKWNWLIFNYPWLLRTQLLYS